MPWSDPTTADGAPGQMGQIDPQVLKRWQMAMSLMNARGPGGMQPSSQMFGGAGGMGAGAAPGYQNLMNQLQAPQQGISPQIMQLIQYYLQNQGQYPPGSGAGTTGPNFPNGGGGINLLQALGFPGR